MIKEETARAQPATRASTCEWRQQSNGTLEEHFEYDANGNRTLGVNATAGTTYTGTYDDQDRLLSYGPFDFTYTANGELETKTNRTTGEEWIFAYDALGNLLSVGLPNGDLVEYLVDGMGRRVGKKKNGVLLKQWLYHDALKPVAELDAAGALVSEFVYGSKSNVPDYVRRGGNTYRLISDQLGSPRYAVNIANASDVPFTASYTSFGVVTGSGLDWMPFGFAGGAYDADAGLGRFGARDFDPVIGRWVARDPILFDGDGPNLYGYVLGDPLNRVDESGEGPVDCVVAVARYLKCIGGDDRSTGNRQKENDDSCNGPDKGHEKALKQKNNRCEKFANQVRRNCDARTITELGLLTLAGGLFFLPEAGLGAAAAL